MKTLGVYGLLGEVLWDVTHATVILQLLYGSEPGGSI